MSKTRIAMLVLALSAPLFQACDTIPVYMSDDRQMLPEPSSQGLVARPNPPIPDVPLPVGFVMVESKSRAYGTGNGRYIEHYYQGRAGKGDTLSFYRERLPRGGWIRRSETNQGGTIMLNYTKGREILELRITDPRNVTTVNVAIRNPSIMAAPSTAPVAP